MIVVKIQPKLFLIHVHLFHNDKPNDNFSIHVINVSIQVTLNDVIEIVLHDDCDWLKYTKHWTINCGKCSIKMDKINNVFIEI